MYPFIHDVNLTRPSQDVHVGIVIGGFHTPLILNSLIHSLLVIDMSPFMGDCFHINFRSVEDLIPTIEFPECRYLEYGRKVSHSLKEGWKNNLRLANQQGKRNSTNRGGGRWKKI